MAFTITLTEHVPWDHHAVHEQAPEPVVVDSAPITNSTSGVFFFDLFSSMVVTPGSCRWSFGCEATVHAPCRPIEDFAPGEIDQGIASVGERT